jgi:hypothetical protein
MDGAMVEPNNDHSGVDSGSESGVDSDSESEITSMD